MADDPKDVVGTVPVLPVVIVPGPTEEQFRRTKVEQAKAQIAARRALRREQEQAC